ncbi:MAG: hypothetical protein IJW37_09860 [Lachnospiraceae bacterium]|nr:hypothetical protein [Lachnospiraceae bacterium]
MKEKLWTCIDYIPEEMPEVTVEKYEKYNILLSECDEELEKEARLLMADPVMTYALSFEALCDAIWGDAGCLKEMQAVGELVGIEVSEEQRGK